MDHSRRKYRFIQALACAVIEVHPVLAEVLSSLLSYTGHLQDSVLRHRRLKGRIHLVIVVWSLFRFCGGLRRIRRALLLLLLALNLAFHLVLSRREQGGLPHQQSVPACETPLHGLFGQRAQLALQQSNRYRRAVRPGAQHLCYPRQVGGHRHPPHCHRRQTKPHAAAHCPLPVVFSSSVCHGTTPYPACHFYCMCGVGELCLQSILPCGANPRGEAKLRIKLFCFLFSRKKEVGATESVTPTGKLYYRQRGKAKLCRKFFAKLSFKKAELFCLLFSPKKVS